MLLLVIIMVRVYTYAPKRRLLSLRLPPLKSLCCYISAKMQWILFVFVMILGDFRHRWRSLSCSSSMATVLSSSIAHRLRFTSSPTQLSQWPSLSAPQLLVLILVCVVSFPFGCIHARWTVAVTMSKLQCIYSSYGDNSNAVVPAIDDAHDVGGNCDSCLTSTTNFT